MNVEEIKKEIGRLEEYLWKYGDGLNSERIAEIVKKICCLKRVLK